MLTKITIRNFKRFDETETEIELGNPVVFIGPNNSGKTSAMQALALWDIGLKRWNEKRSGISTPRNRSGVAINRRDLVAIPTPSAKLLWHDLRVRGKRTAEGVHDSPNIRIDMIVEGLTVDKDWSCGLEFDYANEESFYCRPLRQSGGKTPDRMPIPEEAESTRIAFLPPMSGLAANETQLTPGAIDVRIGEGRTAEVLRNLCFRIYDEEPAAWDKLVIQIKNLFGCELHEPRNVTERGEITMTYSEHGVELDLSSVGRGLQQTLLLLSYMYANPGAVLLLDEPDAHLEILRQRQIYRLLTEVASESNSQIIAASHSEVLLEEASGRDMVVAFVGRRPHRMDDRGSQVLKSLKEIGFSQYYQAEQTGWVLYLEGSTDLLILQAFAKRLNHNEAINALEKPFVKYVGNQPSAVLNHFHGLKEACPALLGAALFDQLDTEPRNMSSVECLMWKRREIENYFCSQDSLETYAKTVALDTTSGPLFLETEATRRLDAMREAIGEVENALATLDRGSLWSHQIKASDEVLDPIFKSYFKKIKGPNLMSKKNFYELAEYVPDDEIDPEIHEKLDAIVRVAEKATPECNQVS